VRVRRTPEIGRPLGSATRAATRPRVRTGYSRPPLRAAVRHDARSRSVNRISRLAPARLAFGRRAGLDFRPKRGGRAPRTRVFSSVFARFAL
jgi:hypothetical protein